MHSLQEQQLFYPTLQKQKVINFHRSSTDFFSMTKRVKRSTLLKIGSSHLHLLYYQRVYMVVANSQTLRPSHCLNGNWVIRSGSSAWVILHLPLILLLSFDGKLMTKEFKTCKTKLEKWGLLDRHICFGFFFNLLPLFKST